jgi:hypothetical protein
MSCAVKEEFYVVPDMPFLEISRDGLVRYVKSQQVLIQHTKEHHNGTVSVFIRFICPERKRKRCKTINTMLVETYGRGAAAAAGYIEPRKKPKKTGLCLVKRQKQQNANLRSCTTCGKPTFNYRCQDCWAELRKEYEV